MCNNRLSQKFVKNFFVTSPTPGSSRGLSSLSSVWCKLILQREKKLSPESGRGFPFVSLFLSLPFTTLTSSLPSTLSYHACVVVVWGEPFIYWRYCMLSNTWRNSRVSDTVTRDPAAFTTVGVLIFGQWHRRMSEFPCASERNGRSWGQAERREVPF